MTDQADTLRSILRTRLPDKLPPRLGIAASGGGDSVALMHLLHEIAQAVQVDLFVATVDHGLRRESAAEAVRVAEQAAGLGIPHETLLWQGWDGTGNLQDQARQARYRLLVDWANRNDIPAIALGHTADDQAETVLMRLGRAAGVTGLSGMSYAREHDGVALLRPMLGITRQTLRDYLSAIGASWIEDPSNHDLKFDRIRAREALSGLEPLGISVRSLSRVAENLAQAREALARYTQESARRVAAVYGGDICVDCNGFELLPAEIQRRLVVGIIAWIAGPGYPPRASSVDQAVTTIQDGQTLTLAGCLLIPQGDKMWFCRELNAVATEIAAPQEIWDNRWILSGPRTPDAEVRALGEAGLPQVPDWRVLGKPRKALLASPAVWNGENLLAAPLVDYSNGWTAKIAPQRPEFYSSLLSH
ncbi:tRNA(Ile)-lysidine synthase [Ruegeria denitrificans]|uniref:tRNA(Ile)-lysidine synthase n=1 Tax=Ruegeria denitrificans TaxID=1715692 RepID=A0A0P1IGQ0_9RHOB|nr:tRNA lysidine(34) synthetase TilS [Ruegeria denitrificans]CUK12182.1 tRNA(Ile)-lysidine synthase [Ruegeria denitrificans]